MDRLGRNRRGDGRIGPEGRPGRARIVRLTGAVALAVALATSAMAQVPPERERAMILDAARLARAAYPLKSRVRIASADGGPDWVRTGGTAEDSGLVWSLSQRRHADGRVEYMLAFAGTEHYDPRDFRTDLRQLLAPSPHQRDVQDRQALAITDRVLALVDQDPKASLTVTGHSLGGGLAQFVAIERGVRAFVFNAAGLGPSTRRYSTLFPHGEARRRLARDVIVNVRLRDDPVSGWGFGEQLGRQHVLLPAHGLGPGFVGFGYHGIDAVIESLETAWAQPERAMWRSNAGVDAGKLDAFAENLSALADLADDAGLFDPKRQALVRQAQEAHRLLGHLSELRAAIRADLAEGGRAGLIRPSSRTLEQLARMQLDYLPDLLAVVDEHRELLHPTLRRALPKELPKLVFLDELADTVGYLARQVRGGASDPDSVEQLMDAVNRTAFGVLGLVATRSLEGAEAYQRAGQALATLGRAASAPAFARLHGWRTGLDKSLVEQWRADQERRRGAGLGLLTIEEYYGHDPGILDLISPNRQRLAELNRQVGLDRDADAGQRVVRTVREHYRLSCQAGVCRRQELPPLTAHPTPPPGGGPPGGGTSARHAPAPPPGDPGGVVISSEPVAAGRLPPELARRILGSCAGATSPACDLEKE